MKKSTLDFKLKGDRIVVSACGAAALVGVILPGGPILAAIAFLAGGVYGYKTYTPIVIEEEDVEK